MTITHISSAKSVRHLELVKELDALRTEGIQAKQVLGYVERRMASIQQEAQRLGVKI